MNKDLNDYLKEIIAGGSSHDGNPSFRGGPYGIGAKKQLAAPLNPATQAMEDQEQAELDQNIQDTDWVIGTRVGGTSAHTQGFVDERNSSDAFSTHLPGNLSVGAIEAPVDHVPIEDPRKTDDYFIDDIIEKVLKEFGMNQSGGVNKSLQLPPVDDDVEDLSLDPAKNTPGSGAGMLVAPQDHVPAEALQQSSIEDDDGDGIANPNDPNTGPELKRETQPLQEAIVNMLTANVLKELLK